MSKMMPEDWSISKVAPPFSRDLVDKETANKLLMHYPGYSMPWLIGNLSLRQKDWSFVFTGSGVNIITGAFVEVTIALPNRILRSGIEIYNLPNVKTGLRFMIAKHLENINEEGTNTESGRTGVG